MNVFLTSRHVKNSTKNTPLRQRYDGIVTWNKISRSIGVSYTNLVPTSSETPFVVWVRLKSLSFDV